MAGMLEEDLAGRLRRVDAHAVCERLGLGLGLGLGSGLVTRSTAAVEGEARLGAARRGGLGS